MLAHGIISQTRQQIIERTSVAALTVIAVVSDMDKARSPGKLLLRASIELRMTSNGGVLVASG